MSQFRRFKPGEKQELPEARGYDPTLSPTYELHVPNQGVEECSPLTVRASSWTHDDTYIDNYNNISKNTYGLSKNDAAQNEYVKMKDEELLAKLTPEQRKMLGEIESFIGKSRLIPE